MKLLLKYPTRQRPEQFASVLNMYLRMLSGKHTVEIIVSADNDDASMQTEEIRRETLAASSFGEHVNLAVHYGNSKSKIEACNADIDKARTDWDVVLLVSDDMIPQVEGYDDIILTEMQKHFPDMDGTLFFNDGTDAAKRNLNTISIIGRKYYDRFGYIYHPEYKSFFCDNEYTEIAQSLGKMKYIDEVIIKHIHPGWGGEMGNDELYKKNDKYWQPDERLFNKRKKNNFGLNINLQAIQPANSTPAEGPVLSILIPTVDGREEQFDRLHAELERQAAEHPGKVEIIAEKDNKQMAIGDKRALLYRMARGKYSVQIDDDDAVAPDYITKVLEALAQNPDCVGYLEECIMDGVKKTACHSDRFRDWGDNKDGYDYVRTIYYKDVIRTEIARRIKNRSNMRFGEDHEFARRLKASRLLKREAFINEVMYYYSYTSISKQEHKERYGIKH